MGSRVASVQVGVLEQIQAVRERLVSSGTVVASDGGVRAIFRIAIGPAEGAALRDRVVETGARRTVETGLGFAMSSLFICEGLLATGGDASHVAIDRFQLKPRPVAGTTYAGVGLHTLEEAGVHSIVDSTSRSRRSSYLGCSWKGGPSTWRSSTATTVSRDCS